MKNIREIIISSIDQSIGLLNETKFYNAKKDNLDIAFSDIDLDSLSRSEVIMLLEDALDLELDIDEVFSTNSVFELEKYLSDLISKDE